MSKESVNAYKKEIIQNFIKDSKDYGGPEDRLVMMGSAVPWAKNNFGNGKHPTKAPYDLDLTGNGPLPQQTFSRFMTEFCKKHDYKMFDADGREVETIRLSVNKFSIGKSEEEKMHIHVIPEQVLLFKPTSFYEKIHVHDEYESMPRKLLRSLADGFKDDKTYGYSLPHIDEFITRHEDNFDKEKFRLATVLTMAYWRAEAKDIDLSGLSLDDKNVKEKSEMFRKLPEETKRILTNVQNLFSSVFEIKDDRLVLSPNENKFLNGIMNPRSSYVGGNIDTDLLKQDYPKQFEKDAGLAKRIESNYYIEEAVHQQHYVHSAISF